MLHYLSRMATTWTSRHTLQMAVRQVRTSRSGSVRRFQAATLRPRIIIRRTSRGDTCSCNHSPSAAKPCMRKERYGRRVLPVSMYKLEMPGIESPSRIATSEESCT